jgi:hypothetical protein
MQWIAAGNGINMNYRFAQTGRTERNRQNHLYIEGRFPFANVRRSTPITADVDSRYERCEKSDTCPLGVEIYSANEYWVKAASLLHTTPDGTRDLPDSKFTRNYFMSSMRHGTGNAGTDAAPEQGRMPAARQSAEFRAGPARALHRARRVGRRAQSRRTAACRSAATARWCRRCRSRAWASRTFRAPSPTCRAVRHLHRAEDDALPLRLRLRLLRHRNRDHQPAGSRRFRRRAARIPDHLPGQPANGPIYPSFIPKTDSDGNDIAGVRLADVTVPLAYLHRLGAAPRRAGERRLRGERPVHPVRENEAERAAKGDPRPSVAARYATFADYHGKIRAALNDMVEDRLLLCEDTAFEENRLMQAGLTRGVPNPRVACFQQSRPCPRASRGKPHGRHDHDDHHGHGHGHDHDD